MRDATDQQLSEWGWKWALRDEGDLVAVTVSPHDAAFWMDEGFGDVVPLLQLQENDG